MAGPSAVKDSMPTDQWMNHRNREVRGQPVSGPEEISSYFGYVPELTAREEADLRGQQAEHHQKLEEINRQNYWMLGPIFAPELLLFGTEAAGAIAARAATKRLAQIPDARLGLKLRFGNKPDAQVGQRVHTAFGARVNAKSGWDAGKAVKLEDGRRIFPDAQTPARDPASPGKRFYLELKPDTPTGRAAGARQTARYEAETGNRARVVYYDVNKYRR